VSQPAVWQQVRALERELDAHLLERRDGSWEPSEDGQLLLELAAAIVSSVDSLKETFERRRQDMPRTLTVIGSPGVLTEELALPVVGFCRHYPHIKVSLLNYAGLNTLDMLLDGTADMAVLPLALDVAGNRRLLVVESFARRNWILLLPSDHPLAGKRRLLPRDLARYPLILPETGSVWRKRVDEMFLQAGMLDRMKVCLEVSIPLAARRYVSLGLGIALFPKPLGGVEFPNLEERSLAYLLPDEEIAIMWRRGAKPRPQARLFADYAQKCIQEFAPNS
jgi:LysR family hydrogen peroxide-inducible transcriptional activator